MRTFSWASGGALILAVVLASGVRAAETVEFPTAIDAYRQGISAHRGGHPDAAARALEYAAERGVLGAQLKLAKMYAAGDGVARNDAKAFRYYQRIADQYADISPTHPVARYVAEAFVALAQYRRDGVPALQLKANAYRAVGLLVHAASYFGDATAQYELARMYLTGEGVLKDTSLAVNWLANASKKQHALSQALLGDILWRGIDGTPRRPLKGLALLELARENASREEAAVVEPLYERAFAEAKAGERETAEKIAAYWQRRPQEGEAAVATETVHPTPPAEARSDAARPAAASAPVTPLPATPASAPPSAAARPTAAVVEATPAQPIGLGFRNVGDGAASTAQ